MKHLTALIYVLVGLLLAGWVCFGFSWPSFQFSAPREFQQANRDLREGRIDQALAQYRNQVQGGLRVGLARNWAVAANQAGDSGTAVLQLERARRLNPWDRAVGEQLGAVRKQASIPAPSPADPSFSGRVFQSLPRPIWARLGLAAGFILALIWGRWAFTRSQIPYLGTVLALLLGTLAWFALERRADEVNDAVVLEDSLPARLAPRTDAEVAQTLQVGQLIHLAQARDGFHWATTREGESIGWVADAAVEVVEGK